MHNFLTKILITVIVYISIISTSCHYDCCSVAEGVKLVYPTGSQSMTTYSSPIPSGSINTLSNQKPFAYTTKAPASSEIITEGILDTTATSANIATKKIESTQPANFTPITNEPIQPPSKETSGLQADASDSEDPIDIGSKTIYTLIVRNNGPTNTRSLKVSSILPKQALFIQAEAQIEDNLTPLIGKLNNEKTQIDFEEIPELAPMVKVIYKVTIQAEAEGNMVHTFEIRTSDFLEPIIKQEGTTVSNVKQTPTTNKPIPG